MKVTLTLDDKLVKDVRRIAAERETTLAGLVRAYLEEFARAHSAQKQREAEALERSFSQFQFKLKKRSLQREHLHARS